MSEKNNDSNPCFKDSVGLDTQEKTARQSNSRFKDSGGKIIFEDPTLCAQFLRDFSGLEILKDVEPEDIEDMTERFLPIFTEERQSDVVKRVILKNTADTASEPYLKEIFVIALIEHKSYVDYNVIMQLLRYMVFIWEDYEKRSEKKLSGVTKRKSFKYPPILPVIYYEGKAGWTAAESFRERIFLQDVFIKFIPDFSYLLVPVRKYGRNELIRKKNAMSLIMLLEQLENIDEFKALELPEDYLKGISEESPENVLDVLTDVVAAMFRHLNVPEDELNEFTDRIKERRMGRLFEHFKGYDVQATRREAREEGRLLRLIEQVCKKLSKKQSVEKIAEDLLEPEDYIRRICEIAARFAPDYDDEAILNELKPKEAEPKAAAS